MTPLFSTLLGACVGSFLNVCINRWKSGEQIFYPPSHCPFCHEPIAWYDNIPVLSFFLLQAKCRFCKKAISWQYPVVEVVTAFLFGLSFCFFHDWFSIVASFVFASFLVIFIVSDLKWKLLPHPFTNFFILAGLLLSGGYSAISGSGLYQGASNFMLVGFVLYGITQIIPKGLGGGDIKLGAGLAIWLGLSKSFLALLLAFGFGSAVVLPLLWLKVVTKKSTIPFGPFMACGSLLLWFWPKMFERLGMVL